MPVWDESSSAVHPFEYNHHRLNGLRCPFGMEAYNLNMYHFSDTWAKWSAMPVWDGSDINLVIFFISRSWLNGLRCPFGMVTAEAQFDNGDRFQLNCLWSPLGVR